MVKDIILSFTDQVRAKTKNPFFGTFIIVWIIRNWQLMITLFNLDLYPTLDEKFELLKEYFADKNILVGLFNTTWISILAIIGTYALLNLSRAIINLFENKVTPWVYKHTMPGEIILKREYNNLEYKYEEVLAKYDEEKSRRVRAEDEREKIEKRLQAYVSKVEETGNEIKIDFDKIHQIILENEELQSFIGIVEDIFQGDHIFKISAGLFLQLGLLEKREDLNKDHAYFRLTSKGTKYWEYLISNGEIGRKK